MVSAQTKNFHDFTVTTIDGRECNLSSFKGKKILVVNVASKCGLTPQYTQLQELYEKYGPEKFIIIGFPANNFGAQEPGTNEEISEFCSVNYGVTFPVMAKISVKGDDIHPLYAWLTNQSENGKQNAEVTWNFQKFMIDEKGDWVGYAEPRTLPTDEAIISWIEKKDLNTSVREAVTRQMEKYPLSTLKDLYKSFFQDRFGPGHIISDASAAESYLLRELDSYSTVSGETIEPTGWQHNFYRVSLSVVKNGLVPRDVLLNVLIRSANGVNPVSVEEWRKEWSQIEAIIKAMDLSLPDYDADCQEIGKRLVECNYVGHHSDAYNEAYAPHYRIIARKIFEEEIFPLLNDPN
jgi:glutathione peroxidase